jgi:hypothetical protein
MQCKYNTTIVNTNNIYVKILKIKCIHIKIMILYRLYIIRLLLVI